MGSREDHKGVLIIESGKGAKAKAYPAAGELALGPKSINNWGVQWDRDRKMCILKAMSGMVYLLTSSDLSQCD